MDETKVNELINKAVETATKPLQDEIERLKSNKENDTKKNNVDYLMESRKKIAIEETEKQREKEITDTVKFNIGIRDFLENNADLLPKDVKTTYENINNGNIGSADEKRKEIQRSIIVSTFENKKAFESLIPSHKEKIENFLSLQLEAQRNKAGDTWEILETYIDKKKYAMAQEKLKRIELGFDVSDDEQAKNQDKFNNAYKFFTGFENSRQARIINRN